MRYLRVILPLLVILATLLATLPVAADDPFGGPPSKNSGDGSTTWGAIYIGDNGCWTGGMAAGAAMWFKADTWKDKHLQIFLDDRLAGAATPKGPGTALDWKINGSAVWGAAKNYFQGKAPGAPEEANSLGNSPQEVNFKQGFAFRVYDPDSLFPNYEYNAPNMWLLTTRSARGANRRSVPSHGWGNPETPFVPNHLLWYEGAFDGWVYIKAYNQMLWNGTMTICAYRDAK